MAVRRESAGSASATAPRRPRRKLGYLPEGAPAYGDMTTRSFLNFIAEIRGFDGGRKSARVDAAIARTGLEGVATQRIETLSKGFKRRVGLAQAILHDPAVLIMDEPTDGLDPNQKHHVRGLITEMAKDKAIIVSTHILEEVEAVCTRAVVIDRGRIVADGTAEDLQRRMPYHNAVAVRVGGRRGGPRCRCAVQRFRASPRSSGPQPSTAISRLRALPKPGKAIAAEVGALLRDQSIVVEEMLVERGKLDDVFRQITTSTEEPRHA